VTAVLGSILVAAAIGFAGSAPYGLAASQFGGRMSFTLVWMQCFLPSSRPGVLRSREFEGAKRART
jgi:hypothetical protein